MNSKSIILTGLGACLWLAAPLLAQENAGRVDSWSRIVRHNDETRTHSKRDGGKNEIEETTYDANSVKKAKRVFYLDEKDRVRSGIIYDGKDLPLGTSYYSYDPYDKPIEEQLFNAQGQLIRRLFFPGALNIPANKSRAIAFLYDPSSPNYDPKRLGTMSVKPEDTRAVRPIQEEDKDFNPGMPIGRPLEHLGGNTQPLPGAANDDTKKPETSNTRESARLRAQQEKEKQEREKKVREAAEQQTENWQPGQATPEEGKTEAPKQPEEKTVRKPSLLRQRKPERPRSTIP